MRNDIQEIVKMQIDEKWKILFTRNLSEKPYQEVIKRSSLLSKDERQLMLSLLIKDYAKGETPIREGYYEFSLETKTVVNSYLIKIISEDEKFLVSVSEKDEFVPFFSIEKESQQIKRLLNEEKMNSLLQYCFNSLFISLSKKIQNGENIEKTYSFPFPLQKLIKV